MRSLRTCLWTALLLAAPVSCYVEVDESSDEDDSSVRSGRPSSLRDAQECRSDRTGEACYRNQDFTWRTSCRANDCRSVAVFAHYMRAEELGNDRTLHIEAFDNAYFHGAPIGKVQVHQFRAALGEYRRTELMLSPGEYYVRAYMTDSDSSVVPYEFGGMELVADQPVGIVGVASGPQSVRVKPTRIDQAQDPVHVYLDKLFRKPGEEPDTKAYVRLKFKITGDAATSIPDRRNMVIRFFESADFAMSPVKEFSMPTENLLITGRVGEADFVTPSLPVGDYYVQVFLDADGNGDMDAEELQAVHGEGGLDKAVRVAANRTVTLNFNW